VADRPLFVRPTVRNPLTPIDAISLYLVGGFQWNMPKVCFI